MYSGSEAVSFSRLIDFVYHSTLGLRVRKKKKKDNRLWRAREAHRDEGRAALCEARGPNFHLVLGFGLSGFGLSGFGFRVSGFGFRVSVFGFRFSVFGLRGQGAAWDCTEIPSSARA